MRLPPEGARWLVAVRWLACLGVFVTIGLSSSVLGVVASSVPLYGIGCAMVGYNLLFWLSQRHWAAAERDVERSILLQSILDLVALTLLLYFSDLLWNPFLFFFVFHMIIASMYLHGRTPYLVAGIATALVGAAMLVEYLALDPLQRLQFDPPLPEMHLVDGRYLMGVFVAFASTLWITVYFTTSIHRYVDRAHA
ncbi:MAG: hypothetical protein ACYSWU_01705, partial [Planctomycetota bacterium]